MYGQYAQVFVRRCERLLGEKFLSKPEYFVLPVLTCEETVNIGQQQDQRDLAIWVFFKFSGKNMKLNWCRVDFFEGQG